MNVGLANNIAQGQAQRDVGVDDREEQQPPSTEVDYHGEHFFEVFGPPEPEEQQRPSTEVDGHGGLLLRCSALRSQQNISELRRRWTAMVGQFLRCPDLRRQPHGWQEGGSLYRHATSDGCNHLAGPSRRQPPLSRTRH